MESYAKFTKMQEGVKSISCINSTVIFSTKDNKLYKLGVNNDWGEFNSTIQKKIVFYDQPQFIADDVESYKLTSSNIMFKKYDNTLWCWGLNKSGTVGDGTFIDRNESIKVAEGIKKYDLSQHVLAITTENKLIAWGNNEFGQIGNGKTLVPREAIVRPEKILNEIKSISAGEQHYLAIDLNNNLFTWGVNTYGELANDNYIVYGETVSIPTKVKENIVTADARGNQTVYIDVDGCFNICGNWGAYYSTEAWAQRTEENLVQVDAGRSSALALQGDGTVFGIGKNDNYQIGPYVKESTACLTMIMKDAIAISSGDYFGLAVKKDGSLWGWGNCYGSNWGYYSENPYLIKTPLKVADNVKQVSAGRHHTMILKKDSSLWVVGSNEDGQIGNNKEAKKYGSNRIIEKNFVKVLSNVKSIYAGEDCSFAILEDDSLWGWGNNEFGKLGDGTKIQRRKPVKIMNDVKSVASGTFGTLFLKNDGSLYVAGLNTKSQLGLSEVTGYSSAIELNYSILSIK